MVNKKSAILMCAVLIMSAVSIKEAYGVTANATIQATVASYFNVSITAQPKALSGDDDLADILINTNDANTFKFAIKSTSPSANFLVNSSGSGAGYAYPFTIYMPEQVAGALRATIAADSGSNAFPSTSAGAVALTNSYDNNRWILTHIQGQAAANSILDLKVKQTTVAPSSLMAGTYQNNVEVQLVDF